MIYKDWKIGPGERCMAIMMDLRLCDMVLSGIDLNDNNIYVGAIEIINRELSRNGGHYTKI